MGSYFHVLVFILFGGYFHKNFCVYTRWSMKGLIIPGEVLLASNLAGARAAAETSTSF